MHLPPYKLNHAFVLLPILAGSRVHRHRIPRSSAALSRFWARYARRRPSPPLLLFGNQNVLRRFSTLFIVQQLFLLRILLHHPDPFCCPAAAGADGHCSQNEGMQKGARPPGRYSHAAPLDQDLDRHTMMECTNNHAAAHVPQPQVQQPHGAPAHMQASLHHMQAAMLGTAPGQQPGNFFSS